MSFTRQLVARGHVVGGGREPLVCVPLVGRGADEILEAARLATESGADLVEWRADYFDDVADRAAVVAMARGIRETIAGMPLIFTLRSEGEGGQPVSLTATDFAGHCAAVCEAAIADFVDVEMSTAPENLETVKAAARANGVGLILSHHDFGKTPDAATLFELFSRAERLGGDVAKVAVMPNNPDDVLTLLTATRRARRELHIPLIGISMGDYGIVTRVTGWLFGSSVTFAAGEGSSAPGQMPVGDLNRVLGVLRRSVGGG